MIRVGVDCRELAGRPTGVGRYLRELLQRWQADPQYSGAELLAFTPDPEVAVQWPRDRQAGALIRWVSVPGDGGTFWEQRALAAAVRAARPDVLFQPAYTAPLWPGRVPTVLAVHDVSFAAHPEWYGWRHGLRLRTLARWSAHRARLVLTLTAFSAREIATHLRVPRDRIVVVPLAVDYLDAPPPPSAQPPVPTQVLFVGSIFERRHLPLLIEGVALARREVPELRLDVIGENRTAPRRDLAALARARGVGDAVQLRDYVSESDLAHAYREAGVFAFLSEYEGFGLTPLEAMRAGLPVVVLDTPVAREVYGDGAWYVRAGDARGVAAALISLLRQPDVRAAQVKAGAATAAQYRWDETARQTWAALLDAVERPAP